MKLNQLPNLRVEDFPSEQTWISKLFTQLNPFLQSVNQVFDQNIDYATNVKSVTKVYNITTFLPFSLQWPFHGFTPMDLRIIQAKKGAQLTSTILLPAWNYDPTDDSITVDNLLEVTESGIAVLSGRYQFTLRVTI